MCVICDLLCLLTHSPYSLDLNHTTQDEDIARERASRESFTDFLRGVLDVDPRTRWTPRQAAGHPFVRGVAFRGPNQPAPGVLGLKEYRVVSLIGCTSVCLWVLLWSEGLCYRCNCTCLCSFTRLLTLIQNTHALTH